MSKRILAAAFVLILVGVVGVGAQQQSAEKISEKSERTAYELFFDRPNTVIVSKTYPVGKFEGVGEVSVKTVWELGKPDKFYAASFSNRTVDAHQLKELEDGLNKIIGAIGESFDKLEATSMSYSTPSGLGVSYYAYVDQQGNPRRNLYMTLKGWVFPQSSTTERLVTLREAVVKARERLNTLGTKY